jgi:hypothetical protein
VAEILPGTWARQQLIGAARQSDDLDRLIDAAILLLTLGPGAMAFFSGLIGAVTYWSVTPGSQRSSADLAAGVNAGLAVGFVIGFPAGAIVALARLTNLLSG